MTKAAITRHEPEEYSCARWFPPRSGSGSSPAAWPTYCHISSAKFGTTYVTRKTINPITSTIRTARIDQRDETFLRTASASFWYVMIAVEYFGQAAALFAGQHRRHVDRRKNPLCLKGMRQQCAAADIVPNRLDIRTELRIHEPVGEQVETLENRQAARIRVTNC